MFNIQVFRTSNTGFQPTVLWDKSSEVAVLVTDKAKKPKTPVEQCERYVQYLARKGEYVILTIYNPCVNSHLSSIYEVVGFSRDSKGEIAQLQPINRFDGQQWLDPTAALSFDAAIQQLWSLAEKNSVSKI